MKVANVFAVGVTDDSVVFRLACRDVFQQGDPVVVEQLDFAMDKTIAKVFASQLAHAAHGVGPDNSEARIPSNINLVQ